MSKVKGAKVLEIADDIWTFWDRLVYEWRIRRKGQVKFAKERDWDQYHTPRNLMLALVGEVGELAELFQWKGEVKEGLPDWSDKQKKDLGNEMADVLVYLTRLADKCHIDLPAAAKEKVQLNALKYPADKVYGSSKKYNEYHKPSQQDSQ